MNIRQRPINGVYNNTEHTINTIALEVYQMSSRKIAWEKWEEVEPKSTEKLFKEHESVGEYADGEEDSDSASSFLNLFNEGNNVVSTPLGFFHKEDINRPSKQYDCWIGHTNFDITHGVQDKIEKIDGVEMLYSISRYKFFVGIGRMFNFSGWEGVRLEIERIVTDSNPEDEYVNLNEETSAIIDQIKSQMNEGKHWAIFVFPNGEYDYVISDSIDQKFINKIKTLKIARDLSGGIFVSSEGVE